MTRWSSSIKAGTQERCQVMFAALNCILLCVADNDNDDVIHY